MEYALQNMKAIWRCERGVAAVEFGLLIPVFLLILFGIVQFGSAYLAYISMTNVARTEVRDFAINGNETECENDTKAALQRGTLSIWTFDSDPTCDQIGGTNKVEVVIELPLDEAMIIPFFSFSDTTITARAVMRSEASS